MTSKRTACPEEENTYLTFSFASGLGVNFFKNGLQKLYMALLAIRNGRNSSCRNHYNPSVCSISRWRAINFGFWMIANDLNFYTWALVNGHTTQPTEHIETFEMNCFCLLWKRASPWEFSLSSWFLGNIQLHWKTLFLKLIFLPFLIAGYLVN